YCILHKIRVKYTGRKVRNLFHAFRFFVFKGFLPVPSFFWLRKLFPWGTIAISLRYLLVRGSLMSTAKENFEMAQQRFAAAFERHLANGVEFISREAYIDPEVEIAPGATILPGCILRGKTVIGANCVIGPNTLL